MSYSYSKISTYFTCPYKYKLKYIDKIETKFEDNAIFEKGRFIHSLLEYYPSQPTFEFKFKEVELKQDEYKNFLYNYIRKDKKIQYLLNSNICIYREKDFFLDKSFNIVQTREESFLNGIIDYVGQNATKDTLFLVDWKTGKTQKHASLDQLKFYCLWAFTNPNITNVVCSLFFIEQDKVLMEKVSRSDFEEIKSLYQDKINTIENDTKFEKRRTRSCENCSYLNECLKMKGK